MEKKFTLKTEDEFCEKELKEFYACDGKTRGSALRKELLRSKVILKRTKYSSLRSEFSTLASKICKQVD